MIRSWWRKLRNFDEIDRLEKQIKSLNPERTEFENFLIRTNKEAGILSSFEYQEKVLSLKKLKLKHRIKLYDLAKTLSCTKSEVSEILKGHQYAPEEQLLKIKNAIEAHIASLSPKHNKNFNYPHPSNK